MNKKQGIIVCIFGIFILSNMASIFSADPTNKPLYVKETCMIEMRDGIHLATDVYLPDEISNLRGAILVRTPYNKDWSSEIGELADVGWPTIVQDMRGRFASEGTDRIFRNAHTDGPDTLEWIASQDWSNGKIATFGGSALGINQYYMAGANPENLACQYIQVATPNLHNDMIYQGGQFRQALVERWLEGQQSPFALTELIEHENYTLDYWTNTSLEDNWGDVHVPAIHIGGWYDCFTQGTIDGFLGYQHLGGDGAKGHSKLIMGPWIHNGGRVSGELTYPENADPSFSFELFIDMFYEYAMDGDYSEVYDFDGWPAVSYYVMGDVEDISAPGNEWRYACDWPIPSYEAEWYFSSTGELQRAFPDDDALTYLYDPSDPIPTVGGQNVCLPQGSYDQSDVEQRDDVLVFTSDTITEPYEATGPIKARLFVSSDCPDTDFTVKLCDVYPNGKSMIINDGIIRMRNRNGLDHWEFMESNEIYCVEVDLWSTSYIWNTGHKIRVSVSSSNSPRFLANPNTKDPIKGNTDYNIAENTLFVGRNYPSCIILPEIQKPYSNPPLKPETPIGPSSGRYGKEIAYEVNAVDPDGDQVYVLFDWGDDSNPGWIGPYNSGEQIYVSHTWYGLDENEYDIMVKAKDINDAQSDWSEPLQVTLPKTHFNPFQQFLERLISLFPFLENLSLFKLLID